MKLKKAIIKNYRQYIDVEIEFSTDKDKNFTIILGNNGTGKTTLLNACNWCLYGSEIHDYKQDSSLGICNSKYDDLLDEGESVEVSVKLEFDDDNGEYLAFERLTYFTKRNGELVQDKFKSSFNVLTMDGDDYKYVDDCHYFIEKTIPRDVEEYFFFDGARLGEYFQKNSNKTIKDAVFNLSQLNLFSKVCEDLKKVNEKYIKKVKKDKPKLGQSLAKISQLENSIEEAEANLKLNKDRLAECKDEIETTEDKLMRMDAGNVDTYVKKEIELDGKIKKINAKLNDLEKQRKKLILKSYPYVLSYNSFKNFLKQGEEHREKKHIPSDFRRSFLEDLLADEVCICGADLSKDTEHRKKIEFMLENVSPLSDKSEEINVALAKVKDIVNNTIIPFKEKSLKLEKDISELYEDRENYFEEKKNISSFLEENPVDKVNQLRALKKSLKDEETKINRFIGTTEANLKNDKKKLGELKKASNSEMKLQQSISLNEKKIEFCKEVIEAAKDIDAEMTENMRKKIEKNTKEEFIKFQWKEDEFVNLKIDLDYNVFIENRSGKVERPGDLSDGELLCLGLCFMSSLHKISGFDLPIMMDTPLGNLGNDIRRNIAKFLPLFVGEKQIILLVTDSEYTDDFRSVLYPHIGKEYLIVWNNADDGKESKVVLNG